MKGATYDCIIRILKKWFSIGHKLIIGFVSYLKLRTGIYKKTPLPDSMSLS